MKETPLHLTWNNSTLYCCKESLKEQKKKKNFVPCCNCAGTQDVGISTTPALLHVSEHGLQGSSSTWTHHRFHKMQNSVQILRAFVTERGWQKLPHNQVPCILLE